jgi:hypothetical protein
MAACICQDVHQVAAFIHECLLARMVGVDLLDLDYFFGSGSASDCFTSVCWALKVAWLILNLMMSLLLAYLLLLIMCVLFWLVIPMSLLLAPSGCSSDGMFLYSVKCLC